MNGYAIGRRIEELTDDALKVDEGSLYPALYRLERRGFVQSSWGTTENNRRAKFYRITRSGRRRLRLPARGVGRLPDRGPEDPGLAVKTLRLWLRALVDSSTVEEEIDDEIQLHLDLRARDYREARIFRGGSPRARSESASATKPS